MRRVRFTISRWMAATAVLGLNISLVRAYLIAEQSGDLDLFNYSFLFGFALQLGLWRYLRSGGKRRRFWLGFVVSGLAANLALLLILQSDLDLYNWYTGTISDLSYFCLPARVDVILSTTHWDWFLALIFFLPELLAAALGGLLAACLLNVSEDRVGTDRSDVAVRVSPAVKHESS